MCGIAGIYSAFSIAPEFLAHLLRPMGHSLRRRGPDSSGLWLHKKYSLGFVHQRLSIQDLSQTGHQPMTSSCGRYTLSFNGEIYNHLDLRSQYTHSWLGSSDTETLLFLISQLGLSQTLPLLAGMFAFSLWDDFRKELILVRDRFGEKPLYWGLMSGSFPPTLCFASDLSALRALPTSMCPPINYDALTSYFQYSYILAPDTIYSSIFHLEPGCMLRVSMNDINLFPACLPKPIQWWSSETEAATSFLSRDTHYSSSESTNQFDLLLRKVVSQCTLSDVPVCTFLSGGIDSSLITAIAQSCSPSTISTFTVAFPDSSSLNEGPYASAISNHLGTNHTQVDLSYSDALRIVPDLCQIYTEPFADSSQIATHLVSKAAKDAGFTVSLTGDGSDELFGGYNRHKLIPLLLKRFSRCPFPLRAFISFFLSIVPISNVGLSYNKRQKLAEAVKSNQTLNDLRESILTVWPRLPSSTYHRDLRFSSRNLDFCCSDAEILMLYDILSYLPNDILVKVDRASMFNSLETRAPFLDFRIAKFAWQIPSNFKIRTSNGSTVTKWILRSILSRYVPDHLLNRPKSGFAVPLGDWLRGPLKNWASDLLSPSSLLQTGVPSSLPIEQIWNQHQSSHKDHTAKLWSVLIWQNWYYSWLS